MKHVTERAMHVVSRRRRVLSLNSYVLDFQKQEGSFTVGCMIA